MLQEALRVASVDHNAAYRMASALPEFDLKSTERLVRAAILLKKSAYDTSAAYGVFKRQKDAPSFMAFLNQFEESVGYIYDMARLGLGMDIVSLNAVTSAVSAYKEFAQGPRAKIPSPNSHVTLGLKGMREGAAAVIDSMQHLKMVEAMEPQDVAILGISLELIMDNLYQVSRGLKMSPPVFDKARREMRRFIQDIEQTILESVPAGGAVEEVPFDQIVLAKLKQASEQIKTNPWLGYRMFEAALNKPRLDRLSFRIARRYRS